MRTGPELQPPCSIEKRRAARAALAPLAIALSLAGCARLQGCGASEAEALNAAGCPGEKLPHDHTPLHGGQVGMVGEHHLEVVDTGGEIRVFFSDACRTALPPPEGGMLVLEPESGAGTPIERPLLPAGSHLRAERSGVELPFLATVKARVGPHQTEMSFLFFEPPDAGR